MILVILILVRLRKNFDVKHLMHIFKTVERAVTNTVLNWINCIYIKLGSLAVPKSKKVSNSMKEKFLNVKCIIDCVEFKIAVLSSLAFHKLVDSGYKGHTTVKGLVGIAPDLH